MHYAIVRAKNDNDTISAIEQMLDQKVTFAVSEVWQWPPWGGEGGAATSPPWMVARLDVTSRGSAKRSHLGQAQADKAICAHVQNGKARERAAGRALMG